MKIYEVIKHLNQFAPLDYAEDFDNIGLIVGDANTTLNGVLVSLDSTEAVVDEAISKHCNLILAFHPIIFSGIKSLNPTNYVNRAVLKAIKNDIAIYAIHTALDNHIEGVNAMMCKQLDLLHTKILIPKKESIKKLTTYVPKDKAEYLRRKLFKAGAGNIGNYSNCSFNIEGLGSFMGNENSNPVYGKKLQTHYEEETQINITYTKHAEKSVLNALFSNHPYEEVAYEIETLENINQNIGLGMFGNFNEPLSETQFLDKLKQVFGTPVIRHSQLTNKTIKKVAVLGGSGAFAIPHAIQKEADALVTADLKYHDFFNAEDKILLTDVGHFESEQYTKQLLYDFINEKITNFAVILSNTKTNPVHYY
jgi:dinuclear metal center YbgI/SA1388 family protein